MVPWILEMSVFDFFKIINQVSSGKNCQKYPTLLEKKLRKKNHFAA